MKTTDNKTARLAIRLTEDELDLLKIASFTIGQTPSKLVRMFIDTTINPLKLKIQTGEIKLEDYKAVLNDKL